MSLVIAFSSSVFSLFFFFAFVFVGFIFLVGGYLSACLPTGLHKRTELFIHMDGEYISNPQIECSQHNQRTTTHIDK